MSYTWIPFYRELFSKILEEYDSKTLATLTLKIFNEKNLIDEDSNGNRSPITEIDPCSFLAKFK